jgi:hypothetical protein
MINEQKEIWISTGNKANYRITIIAVSNCGRIMRKNGKIEIASRRQCVYVGEKRSQMLLHRFLANNFIVKTEEDILKQRTVIDHITHTPDNLYINDVRNLRWCTQRENCNFEEAKFNQSKVKKGKKFTAEHRAKISAALKGNSNSNGNTNAKGKKFTAEHRAKITAANKGNTNAKGKKHSEEAKAKNSAAKKGRHWYNNGEQSVFTYECPLGCVPGMLRKVKH